MASVSINVTAAREGIECITVFCSVTSTLTPATAAALARDLQDAADWASEIDGGDPGEGAPGWDPEAAAERVFDGLRAALDKATSSITVLDDAGIG